MCYNIYTLQLKMISKFLTSLPDSLKDRLFPTIRSNITIEALQLPIPDNGSSRKLMFLYNYQGEHYRLFESFKALKMFLDTGANTCCFETEDEQEIDSYDPCNQNQNHNF